MRGADAEPADLEHLEPCLGHRAAKPRGRVPANREERGNLLVVQAGQREAERCEGRRVEPLEVVDADAERAVDGERSQCCEERGRDRALVDLRLRLVEQQRDLERTPLNRRHLGQNVVHDVAKEVGEPGVREPRLGLRCPADEHPVATRDCSVEP